MLKAPKSNSTFFDKTRSIFVNGLDQRVTEEILWELFLQAGPLENVRIPKDKDTGKQRAFGFVVFQDKCSVPYACELLNSLKLFGRPIGCKPQNSGNESPKQHFPNQSPSHGSSNSDDEFTSNKRMKESSRTPQLQFIGGDDSPYGKTPNANFGSNRRQPLLNRSHSGGSLLPTFDLRAHTLIGQQLPLWLEQNGSHDAPGPVRRFRSMYERKHERNDFKDNNRRRYGQPY